MIRAVRAVLLEPAYAGRFDFEVLSWVSERGLAAQTGYGFGPSRHGLAVLDPERHLLLVRGGHDYGADEIRADLDQALGR